MSALNEIVQAGKVRHIGISNFTPNEIRQCMNVRRGDVLKYGYTLFDLRQARWIFPCSQKQNTGMMVYGSLAYGLLGGALSEDTVFEDNDWRRNGGSPISLKLFAPGIFQRNIQAVNEIKAITEGLGKRLPHLALNWVISHPAVNTVLVGARTVAEVEDNTKALGWRLTDDVKRAIERMFAEYEIDTAPNKQVEYEQRNQKSIDPTDWA